MIRRGVESLIAGDPKLLRRQALLSAMAAFGTSLLYFVADFPHTAEIGMIAFFSGVGYSLFYVFFEDVYGFNARAAVAVMSGMAVLLMGFIVHFSGGIASPFIFLYFCILISEAVYGLENQYTLPLAVASYSIVCVGECLGVFEPANPWAAAVCANKVFALVLIATTVAFMWITRYITGLILTNLRSNLLRENDAKEAMVKKFSELNSTAQLGVLAHRIAHDLRGPLASISGYIQIEMVKEKSPEEKEALHDISMVVANMAESLKGITRFGKTYEANIEKISLSEFMNTLLAIVAFSPQARGVKFIKNYSGLTLTAINASVPDMQQAYFNILKNAVEAVRDNAGVKTIEVSIKCDGSDVVVSIADNGPGMPEEVLNNIFRKSLTTKKDGTGVGLVITRDLLAANDGTIELSNRPEGGLLALTRLPLA
jgi:signal transduction histidine kinase